MKWNNGASYTQACLDLSGGYNTVSQNAPDAKTATFTQDGCYGAFSLFDGKGAKTKIAPPYPYPIYKATYSIEGSKLSTTGFFIGHDYHVTKPDQVYTADVAGSLGSYTLTWKNIHGATGATYTKACPDLSGDYNTVSVNVSVSKTGTFKQDGCNGTFSLFDANGEVLQLHTHYPIFKATYSIEGNKLTTNGAFVGTTWHYLPPTHPGVFTATISGLSHVDYVMDWDNGAKYMQKETMLQNKGASGCTKTEPCGQCQGDCDSDDDCADGLRCFQRSSSSTLVPGCDAGGSGDVAQYDYCFVPPIPQAPTLQSLGGSGCTSSAQCGQCQGDCDSDDDCEQGLQCFQRSSSEKVPGCDAGGNGDVAHYDYCHIP
jgi:hypothetical protein